tara:strand:+ start:3121 stop:3243 length:123 start_codon:yes stop_codon:yes gene_type:complete
MKILSEKGRKYFSKYAKWVDWIILIGMVLTTLIFFDNMLN